MRRFLAYFAILILMACAKRPEAAPEGAKPAEPQKTVETAPEAGFVLPPVKKRQIRYFSEGSPTRAIQDLDDMLDSYILDPKKPEEVRYNEGLKREVLRGTFDVRELCQLALDKHWNERSSQEQDYFVDLMTRLLEKKAVFSKEQGQKKAKKKSRDLYRLVYEGDAPLNPKKTQSLVRSTVHVPTEALKIELNYKLKKVDNHWKIYDVIVDGASLLNNYRYQFDKIIDKDGYATLVHRMESKMRDLQEKSQKEGSP